MDRDDPLWLPSDEPSVEGEVLPATGWTNGYRKRTPEMEAIVLDIIARTGSPKKAAELVGIHPQTIHGWRKSDADFAARYREAMAGASELVMGKAHELALDDVEPSVPIILAMMKFRAERLSLHHDGEEGGKTTGGLDPAVVAKMEAQDRVALLTLLRKYLDIQETERARAIASN
jgi:hypothetical protein